MHRNREERASWRSSYYDHFREAWRTRPETLRREILEESILDPDEGAVQEGLLCPDALLSGIHGIACPYKAFDRSGFDLDRIFDDCLYKPDARYFLRVLKPGA